MSHSLSHCSSRRLACLLAAALATPAAAAPRDQSGAALPRLAESAARRIARRLDADAPLQRLLALCPADVYGRRAHDPAADAATSLAACGRRPDACLARCLAGAEREACFKLAEILQATPRLDPLYGKAAYQLACAAGEAAGCVNRAAGLRNTSYARDPYPKAPAAARQACQFKSFAIGCEAGAAWGCTMRGQAYELGEGVRARDVSVAFHQGHCSRVDRTPSGELVRRAPLAASSRARPAPPAPTPLSRSSADAGAA